MAAEYNSIDTPLFRGVTKRFTYQHQVSGVNAPLTGCKIFFTVKKVPFDESTSDTTAIGEVVTLLPGDIIDQAGGYAEWTWTPPATGIETGTHYADIVVQGADGHDLDPILLQFEIEGKPTNRIS